MESVKNAISDPDNYMVRLFNAMVEDTDPEYAKKLIMALGFEAALTGTKTIRKN